MKKYRIVKEMYGDEVKYYPQQKKLLWWFNIFEFEPYFDGGYTSYEKAKECLCSYVTGIKREYEDFDPSECLK